MHIRALQIRACLRLADLRVAKLGVRSSTIKSCLQSYQVKIVARGEEFTDVKDVAETSVSFSGLHAATSYVIEVTGSIVDGADVEVMPTFQNCMTKGTKRSHRTKQNACGPRSRISSDIV